MKSEIRIIKLERKTLDESVNNQKKGTPGKDEDTLHFFATDYFDSLTVTKKSLNEPLASIMNFDNKNNKNNENNKNNINDNGRKTSVQSYTMYYSEHMGNRYEGKTEDTHRGNPFEQSDKKLRYLSMIQVHITPEVFRRSNYGEAELWKEEKVILEPFLDDLYDIVQKYGESHSADKNHDNFVYRVYQLLSAGDLAVVIKSKYPETSYQISSRIRKRVASINKASSDWVIYKTYTLLAIENESNLYTADDVKSGVKVVVRGCYSCKYWKDRGNAPVIDEEERQNSGEFLGLNGRYDFSVDLNLKEFAQLYPILRQYKGEYLDNSSVVENNDTELSNKVQVLKKLLENGHLSYINERYLLEKLETDIDDNYNYVSGTVKLSADFLQCKTLSKINDNNIDRLINIFNDVEKEAIRLRDAHKNLEQYFVLMRRQIMSCKTINQMSDTRVYVQRIGKQIEIVLTAIDIYREMIEECQNEKEDTLHVMLAILVDDIREAVHMLDSYTEYIRNNNLQSIQTPNYNIESSMSMEKILIGYNEYLGCFMNAYMKAFCMMYHQDSGQINDKTYFPIIIPDLHYLDISVKALFAEGFSYNWEEEQRKREEKGNNGYILIVESPTLKELGDMPVLMALLFHEMAHQFRYISRKERNEILLDMLVDEYASEIASNITRKICWDICGSEIQIELKRILKNAFKEAVLIEIRDYFNQDANRKKWNSPLVYFKAEVIGVLLDLSASWNYQMDFKENIKYFVKSLQKNNNLCKEVQFKYLAKLKELLKSESEENIMQTNKEWGEIREKLTKYAFVIAGLAACDAMDVDSVEGVEWIFNDQEVEKRINNTGSDSNLDVSYEEAWEKLKGSAKDGAVYQEVEWIESAFYNLGRYYQSPTKERECKHHFKCTGKILKTVYKDLCKEWKKTEENYARIVLEQNEEQNKKHKGETAEIYRSWSLVGRYLGIDYEMERNCEKCTRILRNNGFEIVDKSSLEHRVDVYREVTADMFMYILMDMTPFTYLNLIASIIPETNLKGINLERIVTVLYIMNVESNEPSEQYYKAMESMWDEFISYCTNMLNRDGKAGEDFNSLKEVLQESKKDYMRKRVNADFDNLLKKVVEVAQKNKKMKPVLVQIAKICKLLQSVKEQENYFIQLLEESPVMRKDFMQGKDKWRKLRKALIGCTDEIDIMASEGMSEYEKNLIKDVLILSEKNKEHLKNNHYLVGEVNDDDLNESGIKFLLRSYYSQKIKDSRMERDK